MVELTTIVREGNTESSNDVTLGSQVPSFLASGANVSSHEGMHRILVRTTGRFYTPSVIAEHLVRAVIEAACLDGTSTIRVIEPFCGDGRLICCLLEVVATVPSLRERFWRISLWDCDDVGLTVAHESVTSIAKRLGIRVELETLLGDSFTMAQARFGEFDICITNPPWEVLKPDRRDLTYLSSSEADLYVEYLRNQDAALGSAYPLSAPRRKFSGWGTNLARCGTEVALRLTAPRGVCGIVSPASLLADQLSDDLRQWVFTEHKVCDIAYYVAEARLFDGVDQPCITMVASPSKASNEHPKITFYDRLSVASPFPMTNEEWEHIKRGGYKLPLQFGLGLFSLRSKWEHLPKFSDFEGPNESSLWAGRELDETGHQSFLCDHGTYLFVKGKMIKRYGLVEAPSQYIGANGPRIPISVNYHRLVWRDVSRPTQKRRLHAAIIPPGYITGNSLNVAYYRDNNEERLKALLAIVNSFVFETQVRMHLATAHISLGAVRKVHIPSLSDLALIHRLALLTERCQAGDEFALAESEVAVAQLYGLSRSEFEQLLSSFDKVTSEEQQLFLAKSLWYGKNSL